mgnify:FL=1
MVATNFENFINSLVNLRTQLGIKKKLNKIYPVKEVVIRSVRLIDSKGKTLVMDKSEKLTEESAVEEKNTEEVVVATEETEQSEKSEGPVVEEETTKEETEPAVKVEEDSTEKETEENKEE